MRTRQREDSEALREVILCPGDELGLFFLPFFTEGFESSAGVGFFGAGEDGSDLGGNRLFEVLFCDVVLSVLLEVGLATLPRCGV